MTDRPKAIVIGAGFTGCALAHDLALRGFDTQVIERGEIASGTSGRTHGLLHSGGRYCVNDQDSARECIEENIILRRIARQSIEFNGGLFVALDEKDEAYAPRFEQGARQCGIDVENIPVSQALRLEPNLNPAIRAAYTVPDGVFDPLRLALCFAASARSNGARFLTYHDVTGLILHSDQCKGVVALDRRTHTELRIPADMVINAAGAWASRVLGAGFPSIQITPTPGIMIAFDRRLVNRVINRLTLPDDGDILIPQRRMVVIGTTSYEDKDVDYIPVKQDQKAQMLQQAARLVPAVKSAGLRGVYMSARPLVGVGGEGRSLARTFKCFDHQVSEGVSGLITITGGKATTCRAMAEAAADLACRKLDIISACQTRDIQLLSYRDFYRKPAYV